MRQVTYSPAEIASLRLDGRPLIEAALSLRRRPLQRGTRALLWFIDLGAR